MKKYIFLALDGSRVPDPITVEAESFVVKDGLICFIRDGKEVYWTSVANLIRMRVEVQK